MATTSAHTSNGAMSKLRGTQRALSAAKPMARGRPNPTIHATALSAITESR